MRLQVKGKNVEVTAVDPEYAETKLGKLEKQLAEPTQVEVELSEEKNPSIHGSHVAEATIFTKGPTLRAREASTDMRVVDRPARREARTPGEALPREAAREPRRARRAPQHRRRSRGSLGASRRAAHAGLSVARPSEPPHAAGLDDARLAPRRAAASAAAGVGRARRAASRGIHGVHRAAPLGRGRDRRGAGARGDRAQFVALSTTSVLVEEDEPDDGVDAARATRSKASSRRRIAPRRCGAKATLWAVARARDRGCRAARARRRRDRARRRTAASAR